MTVINTNVKSLIAQASLAANNKSLSTAMERLSTGSRINSAKDDAAGLAISSRMTSQIRGLNMAVRNANDAISLVQTAEGSMDEISNMLQRMRELAIQAASDVNNSADRANLDAEVQQLKTEIDRIVDTTRFNDKKILDGSFSGSIQIGAKAGETMDININNVSSLGLGSITGTVGEGVVSASATGEEATPTVARMSFSENGDYTFTLTVEGADGQNYEFDIDASVAAGSATGIMDAINDALGSLEDDAATPVTVPGALAETISVTASGKSITIENLGGGQISVSAFTGSTTSFTTVSGGTDSDSLILKTAASDAVTAFDVSDVTVTDREASTIVVTPDLTAVVADDDELVFTLVANGVTTILSTDALTGADVTADADGVTALITALKASDRYAYSGYLIYADDAGTGITFEREDGASFQIDANFLDLEGATIDPGDRDFAMAVADGDLLEISPVTVDAGAATANEPNAIALSLVGLDTLAADDTVRLVMTANGATEVFTATIAGADPTVDDLLLLLREADNSDNYEFYKNSNDQLVVKNMNGETFSIDAAVVDDALDDAALKVKVPNGIDLVASVTPYTVNSTSSPKSMFITFSGTDTYSLAFDNLSDDPGDAISFAYTGTSANMTAIAAQIQAELDALPAGADGEFDFQVTVENGSIRIDESNGYAFGIASFASESNGTAIVRSGYGQESASGATVAYLDDTEQSNTATAVANGLAAPTALQLTFDALTSGNDSNDTYSFTISDGVRSARITNVERDGNGGNATMLSAMRSALTLAGMDDVLKVYSTGADSSAGAVFTLYHELGREISISDFMSTGTTSVEAKGVTNANMDDVFDWAPDSATVSTGIARYLDDNYDSASGSVVRDIDVTTASRAQDAIDVLDYAINDVAAERANLGAIQSRLDHTINNLTSISVNTEASRSRIMDADYGTESANLARAQIIQQAATAMLAQANQSSQSVLSLLQ
jgi:flagellin